jgi:hypothetical protein
MRNRPRRVTKVNCATRRPRDRKSPEPPRTGPNGSMPQALSTRHQRPSEFCVIRTIYANPSNLVSRHADRPALVDLVIPLN